MKLSDLIAYKNIIIQLHDNPDADTMCSGFALQCFFNSRGTEAKIVYGGRAVIQKPSLLMLAEALKIDVTHTSSLPEDTDLLITVDGQRGAGNVFAFELPENARVAVIDHHKAEIPENAFTEIRPELSSCATVVWDMLNNENFDMDDKVQTALFYGLYTDTNGLAELRHPLDRDLAEIPNDTGLIRVLRNSAITDNELNIIGKALLQKEVIGKIELFESESCDANLLGFASDIAQQVVNIDCCIVYCLQSHGVKLSIRSSTREIMANEISAFICKDAGSGGGSIEKAGGFMSFKGITDAFGTSDVREHIVNRIRAYNAHYDLIYADNNDIDFASFKLYKKLPLPVGFAKSTDIFTSGTRITVRTLEGDLDIIADGEVYLMIGIIGEVYPIKKPRFEASYAASDAPFTAELEYAPSIINRFTGEKINIMNFAKTCIPKDSKLIRARELTKATKVFTNWDKEKYFSGQKGDLLAANENAFDDCYVIRNDIFTESYGEV